MAARRLPRLLAAAFAILVVGALAGWSLRVLLAPPSPTETASPYALVTAQSGQLGRAITLNSSATRQATTTLVSQLDGTLTSLDVQEGESNGVGSLLYTVDMLPVVLAEGTVPAYRTLTEGMKGPDVVQLQRFLNAVGGYGLAEDGEFAGRTTRAVLEWNRSLGIPDDPTVPLGRIVFAARTPLSLTWADDVELGTPVHVGDPIGKVLADEPTFTMTIPSGQLALVSEGMPASISTSTRTWDARIGPITIDPETNEATTILQPAEGATSICGDECALIPAQGAKGMRTTITVVPERSGVVVPTSALRVDANGATVLIDEGGALLPVEVLVSVSGRSIVTGVDEGTRLRVLSTSEGSAADSDGERTPDSPSSAG
ncbi:peptidoglycan-binding protein [Actinomyces culturomici]|uniref:peptidoglycan-binding protein n=1 Tax=Actinomyces culturomici TaxID=1926276 RepID=UPI0013588371|nr:peptidoglycan-binding protein [Actinomyces culturomici]